MTLYEVVSYSRTNRTVHTEPMDFDEARKMRNLVVAGITVDDGNPITVVVTATLPRTRR